MNKNLLTPIIALLFASAFFNPSPNRNPDFLPTRHSAQLICHCEPIGEAISSQYPRSCHCAQLAIRNACHCEPIGEAISLNFPDLTRLSNRSEASASPFSNLSTDAYKPPAEWEKLSSYTTYFNKEERDRSENIAIAASLIDGIIIQPYGEFSFNQTVGRRTSEAGFKQAKIIVDGEYVLGVGGGVCQVSTTLYNAALKSGLSVNEFHPHSLRVAYVDPSRDAMVSTHSDLKLYNPYAHPVRLKTQVFDGGVKVTFFGKNEGDRYEIISKTVGEIPPPPPIIKEGDTEEIIRSPKNGTKSEAYLERYRGETLLSRKRIRTDEYRPVQGIIVKKIIDTTN